MKKLLVLALSVVLVLGFSIAALADVTTNIHGEAYLGFKNTTAVDDNQTVGEFNINATAVIDDNVTVFGKIKTWDAGGHSDSYSNDEVWASAKFGTVTTKVGYFGWGFGGDKDILNTASDDFKGNRAALLVTVPFAEGFNGEAFYSYAASKKAALLGDGAYGVGLSYAAETWSIGVKYGDSKSNDESVTNSAWGTSGDGFSATGKDHKLTNVTASYKGIESLDLFLSYTNLTDVNTATAGKYDDVTTSIVGVIWSPADLPWIVRAEYDLNDELKANGAGGNLGSTQYTDFNPWGFRICYKINNNPNTLIRLDRNQCTKSGGATTELKYDFVF